MSQPSENLRARRTRKLLREALTELIQEHGFERTTVRAIAERAMVSRAAYYRNYKDKYDLVEQIFEEAIQILGPHQSDDDEKSNEERWVSFFEHFAEHHQIYEALLSDSGSQWFANRMRGTLAEMIKSHLPEASQAGPLSQHTADMGLVPTLISALFVQSITWWLANDQPTSAHQMADRFGKIATAVVNEVNSWKITDDSTR